MTLGELAIDGSQGFACQIRISFRSMQPGQTYASPQLPREGTVYLGAPPCAPPAAGPRRDTVMAKGTRLELTWVGKDQPRLTLWAKASKEAGGARCKLKILYGDTVKARWEFEKVKTGEIEA